MKNRNMIDFDLLSKALRLLQDRGWSDLIDKKYKNEVVDTIKQEFPEINKETMDEVLNCVLW